MSPSNVANSEGLSIDDQPAMPVMVPTSLDALRECVQKAKESGQALFPTGGRTMLDLGLPPSRAGMVVDMREIAAVEDYPARDMTVTVQAGITISKLQELLASENQQLPIDIPCPSRATLGGVLAVNSSGPRRYGYGTLRDYVIGISAMNDAGEEIKAGGRVVKNVAGYDLCKLYVGALGTLGILSRVTLKVRPCAESRAFLGLGCPARELEALLALLHGSRTRPTSLSVLHPAWARDLFSEVRLSVPDFSGWLVLVGFEENEAAVAWQCEQLRAELQAATPLVGEWRRPEDYRALLAWMSDFPVREQSPVVFKASLLPHAVGTCCEQLRTTPEVALLQVEAGNGIIVGHLQHDVTQAQAEATLRAVLDTALSARGNLVVLRCPCAWKATLPIWGQPRDDLWLVREVKRKLDPCNIFNPGRFVDAL